MAVSIAQFIKFVGESEQNLAEKTPAIEAALETATDLVDDTLSGAYKAVPVAVYDRLVLEVGHEILRRQDSPTGASTYADFSTGQPVQGPRDPLARVWPIVRRYVLPF